MTLTPRKIVVLPLLQTIRSRLRELGRLGPLALFMVAGPLAGAIALVMTSGHWVDRFASLSLPVAVPLFIGATIVLAGLSLMPTHAASLVGGMVFGAAGGAVLALSATAGAALLGFWVLRRMVGYRAIEVLATRPRAAAIHRALLSRRRRVVGLIALIRLSPVMPFAATNLLMAAARVDTVSFLVGSMVGIAPRVVAVAVAGAGLAELDLSQGGDARLAVLGGIATLLVLELLRRIATQALRAL